MATQDLFKQAIADAKSIREAAIANAKLALEESITPELKELLAAKLQEMEEEVEEEVVAETSHEEEVEETYNEEVEEEVEEVVAEEEEADEEAEDDSEESEDEAEEEEVEGEEPAGDEEIADSELTVDDLKDMIRDIIAQEMGEDEMEMDSEEGADDMMDVGAEELPMEDEEEIDINELLAELSKEIDEEVDEEANDMDKQGNQDDLDEEVKEEEVQEEVSEELEEALAQIEELKTQLQETNLLNAKLLYVNKVFKGNNLTESQKANVIATFDKAETVKEVKLVYETVAESFTTKKEVVKESRGFASAAVGNAPSKPEVINEVSAQVLRMQKLAGIIK